MNVAVEIRYKTDMEIKVSQKGSFPARGRSPEKVAYDWWRELKKEMNVEIKMEQVIVDGEDITQQVKGMES